MNGNKDKIVFANALRGFAAVSVIISHYLGVYWYNKQVTFLLANVQLDAILISGMPKVAKYLNCFPLFNSCGAFGVALFF